MTHRPDYDFHFKIIYAVPESAKSESESDLSIYTY